jgi:hypothetical protein
MITSSEACAKWIELADREALGEELLPREASELRAHEAVCQACLQEAAAFRSLSTGPLEAVPNDAQVEQILRAAGMDPPTSLPAREPARRSSRAAVALALAGVAAAAATWLVVQARQVSPAASPQIAKRSVLEAPPVRQAPLPTPANASNPNQWATSDIPSCRVFLEDITVCLDAHSEARTDQLVGAHAQLELARGHAVASLPTRAQGSSFAIQTSAGSVTAVGTIFSVEVGAPGPTVARVLRGEVAVQAIGAQAARRLRAGESTQVDAASAVVALTAEERSRELSLLPSEARAEKPLTKAERAKGAVSEDDPFARARLLRGRGQFAAAAALYESIHQASPESASGRAALLGLAELRLSDLHDAAGALRAFDAYLAGGNNALSREAAFGRIRALRALGKSGQERAAIEAFLRAYPSGPEAESLRQRLSDVRGP